MVYFFLLHQQHRNAVFLPKLRSWILLCDWQNAWQLVPASDRLTSLMPPLPSGHHSDLNYSSVEHFEMEEIAEEQIPFFLSFNQVAFLSTGNSVSNKPKICRSRWHAALRERSMRERACVCVHEWKPLLTMVRHEMSYVLHALSSCLIVSQSAVSGIIAMIRKRPFVQMRESSLFSSLGGLGGGRGWRGEEEYGLMNLAEGLRSGHRP